jgi:hypothetical protein
VRAVAKEPHSLPRDVLFRDYIRSEGEQVFMVKAPPAEYVVSFLHPNGTVRTESIAANDGLLLIRFPRGDWTVSGLVIKGPKSQAQPPSLKLAVALPRPRMTHEPPASAQAGKPLTLSIKADDATLIRLHYRPLNQNLSFKVLEGETTFTIPGKDISARWDLMYYFEVLNKEKSGWFYPDPASATPYFVVTTRP